MTRFAGKVCIVTGGASGIGARTAEAFAEQGGTVVIGDVNDDLGKQVAARIGEDAAAYVHLDVTDPAACQAAVEFAVERFGGVDCVVNSAIKMAPGALKDLSLDDWNTVVNVGLTGSFLMSQAAGRWMIDNGRKGSIVNLSSNGGRDPYGMSGAYSTVKSGLLMLARHLAIEWAQYGIRANAVCPGHTETPLTQQCDAVAARRTARGHRQWHPLPALRRIRLGHRGGAGHRWRPVEQCHEPYARS